MMMNQLVADEVKWRFWIHGREAVGGALPKNRFVCSPALGVHIGRRVGLRALPSQDTSELLAGHQAELEAKMREEALAKVRAGTSNTAGPSVAADTPIAYRDANGYPAALKTNQVRLQSCCEAGGCEAQPRVFSRHLGAPTHAFPFGCRHTWTARQRHCLCRSTAVWCLSTSAVSAVLRRQKRAHIPTSVRANP